MTQSPRLKQRLPFKHVHAGKAATVLAAFLFLLATPVVAHIGTGWGQVSSFETTHDVLPSDVTDIVRAQTAVDKQRPFTCSLVGDAIRLNTDGKYYVVYDSCAGSASTPLWIVAQQGNEGARILLSSDGFALKLGITRHQGLRDLRTIARGIHDASVTEWHFDGAQYRKFREKSFAPDDCENPATAKDGDFPWYCD